MRTAVLSLVLVASVAKAEEVVLLETGPQVLPVVAVLRELTRVGQQGGRETIWAPKPVLVPERAMTRAEAETLVKRLLANGATAVVHKEGAPLPPVPQERFAVTLVSSRSTGPEVATAIFNHTGQQPRGSLPAVVGTGLTRAVADSLVRELTALGAKATVASSVLEPADRKVLLTQAGEQKIPVIIIVRDYTQLDLKQAKEFVEASEPQLVRDFLTRAEAEVLVAALAAKGATAEIQQKGAHQPAHPRKEPTAATFDVKLESWGQSKIMVIKLVRERTGLGLKETKELVEAAPTVVLKGQTREAAESMVNELVTAGARASLVPR